MFRAINKKDGKGYWARQAKIELKDTLKTEEWYAPEDEIQDFGTITDGKIPISFREALPYEKNGILIKVRPHFYIPNKEKLGVVVIRESKAHRIAKSIISNQLYDVETLIIFDEEENNLRNILRNENKDIKIESTEEYYGFHHRIRVADVVCRFEKPHKEYGRGIVFEIDMSKGSVAKRNERFHDWILRKYSICFLDESFFEDIDEEHPSYNGKRIVVYSYSSNFGIVFTEINRICDEKIQSLRDGVANYEQKVQLRARAIQNLKATCESCRHFGIDKDNKEKRICWIGWKMKLVNHPDELKIFAPCHFYERKLGY